jgi:beta-apo-4'-carotenal oxygenase
LKDNADAIAVALKKDIGKGEFETNVMEIDWCTNGAVFANNNLKSWAKDEPAPDVPLLDKLMSPKIRKDPLGAVLIIG